MVYREGLNPNGAIQLKRFGNEIRGFETGLHLFRVQESIESTGRFVADDDNKARL